MRAGELRHRITIQKPTTSRSTSGQENITWSTLITIWGAIWPLRGREYMDAQQIQSAVTHKIRIRRLPSNKVDDFDEKCRLIFGSRTFQIISIIRPDERNIYYEIMAREQTT